MKVSKRSYVVHNHVVRFGKIRKRKRVVHSLFDTLMEVINAVTLYVRGTLEMRTYVIVKFLLYLSVELFTDAWYDFKYKKKKKESRKHRRFFFLLYQEELLQALRINKTYYLNGTSFKLLLSEVLSRASFLR